MHSYSSRFKDFSGFPSGLGSLYQPSIYITLSIKELNNCSEVGSVANILSTQWRFTLDDQTGGAHSVRLSTLTT
ncbi:protein of unknown function [Cyanobium sp. NIES-981]|nr:protein of unknown function [Cyanobium sp. NIES-981]